MSHQPSFERRIAGYALAAGAAVATSTTARAAVQYHDLDPDVQLFRGEGDQAYDLDVDGDLTTDFTLFLNTVTSTYSGSKIWSFQYVGWSGASWSFTGSSGTNQCVGAVNGNGWVAPLNSDLTLETTLGAGTWVSRASMGWIVTSYGDKMSRGYFRGKNQRFLGLQFRLADGWHHGWCRLSIDKKANSFTVHDYAYEDTSGDPIVTGLLRANRLAGTVGNRVALNAADVAETGGAFTAAPKLVGYYIDPVKGKKTAKAAFKGVLSTDAPAPSAVFELKKKVKLYDAKAFKTAYKEGRICRDFLSLMVGQGMFFNLDVRHEEGGIPTLDQASCVALLPPQITGAVGAAGPGGIVTVSGNWFGVKPPKAWLEYRVANPKTGNNITKTLKLKVVKPYAYANAKGKLNASCMDVDTGESQVQIQLPAAWPDNFGLVDIQHYLVLDNGIGLATWLLIDP